MATSEMKLTFGFGDDTKRDIKLAPFDPNSAAITGAKTNIMDFNENKLDAVKGLILSDDGESTTGIVAASIITVNETEINLNDAE